MNQEDVFLRKIYGEILQGFSPVFIFNEHLFIKHLTSLDQASLDEKYFFFLDEAKKNKIPLLKERVDYLLSKKLWTKEKELELDQLEILLTNLKKTKSKYFLLDQIKEIEKQIQETSLKLNTIQQEKNELIGNTAESYADKKVNQLYIQNSIFKDKELVFKRYGDEEFSEIDDLDLAKIVNSYNLVTYDFKEVNLKKIAIQPFFLNFFYLCEDNPYYFYGKPISLLTFNQSNLFSLGKTFKYIFINENPPDYITEEKDPDKILDWYNLSKNAKNLKETRLNKESGATTIVGAKKQDLQNLGLEGKSIHDLAREKGSLSMEDMLKMDIF